MTRSQRPDLRACSVKAFQVLEGLEDEEVVLKEAVGGCEHPLGRDDMS